MRVVQGAALALLLVALGPCGCADETPARRTNLLLVSVDTLRADHLSAYGHRRPTSPALDRLAQDGVLFTDLVAPRGQTWPSIASLLTSMHPRDHGVRSNGNQLDPELPTLARSGREAGYAVGAFLTNMFYAHYADFDPLQKTFVGGEDRDQGALLAALAWLREQRGRPFLLWLHLSGPHDPYAPSKRYARAFSTGYRGPYDGRSKQLLRIHRERIDLSERELAHLRSLYDAEVRQVDARISELLAEVDRLGLRRNTLVVVLSDHGDALYDHDHYFLHHLSIHRSVLHVPLIMRLPGRLPAGQEVGGVVRMMDVAPTILALLGLETPESFRGSSLLPRIRGQEAEGEQVAAFSELGPSIHSVSSGRWHFISNPEGYTSPAATEGDEGDRGDFTLPAESLYDVAADPTEKWNLVEERPQVAARLRARLARWRAERGDRYEKLRPMGEMILELRALGYLPYGED